MKRILLVCLLVVGLLLMASCGGGYSREATDATAIEDTIRGYFTTFNAEDFDKCLTYFTDYEDKEDALAFLSFIRSLSVPLELREIKDIAIFPPAVLASYGDAEIRRQLDDLRKIKSGNVAKTIMARRLLKIVYHVLKERRAYVPDYPGCL